VAAPIRHAASLEEIAAIEGTTPRAIHTLISRALRKLRNRGLLVTTARALALELESHRETENIVRTVRRGR
jgi:DNA-binding CsgD family transcriptional regulator